jgi:hypothetical protein
MLSGHDKNLSLSVHPKKKTLVAHKLTRVYLLFFGVELAALSNSSL